ncbi:peptidase domain-containing ABC transporter [Photorhabdus kleinii]|uniref:peptidase domain-containing ABC transporter n=1 Tax=Photorhabdus kleinii TaxID=768034 RepID=UPI0021D4AF84|nr:peptidase domain-containing ABC transporter [Photorhabdus kleinii]
MSKYVKDLFVAFSFGKSLPVIIQSEVSECGLACIAMIAGYHGFNTDLLSMRKLFEVSQHGMSLKEMIIVGEKLGLSSCPVRVELEELRSLSLPCILHWSFNHFVVLKKLSRKGAVIHDPGIGERRITLSELSNCFTGVALEMKPGATFERKKVSSTLSIRDMLAGIEGKGAVIARLIAISAAIELVTLLIPASSQFVIDNILSTSNMFALNVILAAVVALLFMRMLLTWLRDWIITAAKYSIGLSWSEGFLSKLISLPVTYFKKRYLGDIASRLQSLNQIQEAFTARMVSAILDAVITVSLLVVMSLYSVVLCASVAFLALLYALIKWFCFGMYRSALAESINKTAVQSSHFIETARGVSAIKMLCLSSNRKIKWLNLSTESITASIKLFRIDLAFRLISAFVTGLVACLVIYVGAQLAENGFFTAGVLFAFMMYADMFIQRTINFCDAVYEFKMLSMHTDRLSDVALTESEDMHLNASQNSSVEFYGGLEISSLSFAYSAHDPYVFEGLSFVVEPGESIAFVGSSGCGKSTLLHVLASLLEPVEGVISINGIPISNIGLEAYRKHVSYVMQDDFLFTGSLQENITCFAERADIEFMHECARVAAIHDEIEVMPNGYNSMVGDMGSALSGGQKQRISLARALYRRPKILILDESTSALDIENERKINEAVKAMKITRLFAAHRPDTIAVADRVFDIVNGVFMDPQEYLQFLKCGDS